MNFLRKSSESEVLATVFADMGEKRIEDLAQGNSMTTSERPSPEPLEEKRCSSRIEGRFVQQPARSSRSTSAKNCFLESRAKNHGAPSPLRRLPLIFVDFRLFLENKAKGSLRVAQTMFLVNRVFVPCYKGPF